MEKYLNSWEVEESVITKGPLYRPFYRSNSEIRKFGTRNEHVATLAASRLRGGGENLEQPAYLPRQKLFFQDIVGEGWIREVEVRRWRSSREMAKFPKDLVTLV